jgi:hypothetical protein
MGKFWILIHNEKIVQHYISYTRSTRAHCGVGYHTNHYCKIESRREAEQEAQRITKKHGGDCYVMECVAMATIPATIVKVE